MRGLFGPARGHRLSAAAGIPGVRRTAGPARPRGQWAPVPKGEALGAVARVRHCPGRETGPLREWAPSRAGPLSGPRTRLRLPPRCGAGGEVRAARAGTSGEGRLAAATVITLRPPHVAGAARPRA